MASGGRYEIEKPGGKPKRTQAPTGPAVAGSAGRPVHKAAQPAKPVSKGSK